MHGHRDDDRDPGEKSGRQCTQSSSPEERTEEGVTSRERRLMYTEVTTDPKNVGKPVVSGDSI